MRQLPGRHQVCREITTTDILCQRIADIFEDAFFEFGADKVFSGPCCVKYSA